MTFAQLISFAVIYFVFVVTPGPGIAAIVARGLGIGLRHGVPFLAGFVLGDMTWFLVGATGLSTLATQFSLAFIALKYAGCAYLVFLAWKMWNSSVVAQDVEALNENTTAWGSFAGSLSLTLSNPKVVVFFVSLMPLVVDVQHITAANIAAMAGAMAIVGAFSVSSYLLLAKMARQLFTSTVALRRINRGSAGLMAAAAVAIAAKG